MIGISFEIDFELISYFVFEIRFETFTDNINSNTYFELKFGHAHREWICASGDVIPRSVIACRYWDDWLGQSIFLTGNAKMYYSSNINVLKILRVI